MPGEPPESRGAMSINDSRSEYARRMHRVLEHIDRHLDEPLELDALAGVAHFSPFHFHRLFSAWMGETLGDYLRRRRLEMAGLRLVAQPDVPVLHVALSVGFGSAEAFARAFKARFACTPTAWRAAERARRRSRSAAPTANSTSNADARFADGADSKPGQANRKHGQATTVGTGNHGPSRDSALEVPMNVTLVDRQPTTVAYLRYVGPYGQPVSEFWQHTVYPWMVANNLLGRPRFGVSHDDPGITAAAQCRYDAGVEVPSGFVGTGAHLTTTVPGGKYAVMAFKGRGGHEIVDAWAALLRDWLPASGLQLDARPFFEYYSTESTFDPHTGVFTCDLCIPVATL